MKIEPMHYEAIERGGSVLIDGEFITTVEELEKRGEKPAEKSPEKTAPKKD